jgi:regulatory protein
LGRTVSDPQREAAREAEAEATPEREAYAKAVDLLSRRPHFRRQLADKLSRRGFDEAVVESVLDRLESHRYLDDRQTTRDFVESKLSRGPLGRRRLAADLAKRGAPREIADEVLAELLPDDDRAAARQAAEAWLARRRAPKPQALAGYLERRGFSPAAIWAALDAADLGRDEPRD